MARESDISYSPSLKDEKRTEKTVEPFEQLVKTEGGRELLIKCLDNVITG